jgi:CBS domain containing-hemolysin-like protein
MSPYWLLPSIPFLIAINAFFVAAEYAVVATRPMHIDALRRSGRRAAASAMETLKRRTASTIGTIQVCITATNLLLGWLGEPAMSYVLRRALGSLAQSLPTSVFRPLSVTLSFFVVTLLTVVFSELLPKALTLRRVVSVASLTAVPVLVIARGVRPIVWVMNQLANAVTVPLRLGRVDRVDEERVTTEEIRLLTAQAADEGELTPRERAVILNALTLADRPVTQIMVPRVRVTYVDLKWTMEENRAVINERLFSRVPLCNGGMDTILGIVHTKEFLTAYHAEGDVSVLALIAREPVFVPETHTMDKLLSLIVEKHSQMVIVLDEHGGVSGVVTLRDTIDSLLGKHEAPGGAATSPLAGAASLSIPQTFPGDMLVHDLAQRMNRHDWCARESAATLGGLVQDRLGRFPVEGEEIEAEGVRLRVIEADDRRALRVEVRASEETPAIRPMLP